MSRKWWARCARPTLHAYPPASFLLSAFSFTRPILGLEVRRPVRYIRRCTFVRVCSLTFRQTFDRRCPACYRCAGTVRKGVRRLLCEARDGPFREKVPDTFFGPTLLNHVEVRGGSCVISRYTAITCGDRFFVSHLNDCRITAYGKESPSMGVAYFGGNASCKALLNNDLQRAHPQGWLFFGPKKPRKNSEGVL